MMVRHLALAGMTLTLVLLGASAVRAEDAEKLVQTYLSDRDIRGHRLTPISEKYLSAVFPDISFFSVRFRLYPVAIQPPEGLSSSNIFYVKSGEVFFMTTSSDLEDFFFDELPAVGNEDDAKDAGRSWLRLTQEFVQDDFYRFSESSVEAISFESGVVIWGRVTVEGGGRGAIRFAMIFDLDGLLTWVAEGVRVMEGIRPICQATKLLDPDPIIRKMAEKDILVMGKAAKDYLDEQRAKANPELQKAIDRIWKRILDEGW